jgi:hypothetical protein
MSLKDVGITPVQLYAAPAYGQAVGTFRVTNMDSVNTVILSQDLTFTEANTQLPAQATVTYTGKNDVWASTQSASITVAVDVDADAISYDNPLGVALQIQQSQVPKIIAVSFNQNVPIGGTFTTPHLSFAQFPSWIGTMYAGATGAGLGATPYVRVEFDWSLAADNFDPLRHDEWVVPTGPVSFFSVYRNDMCGPVYGDTLTVTYTNYDTEPCVITHGIFGTYQTRLKTELRGRYHYVAGSSAPDETLGIGSDLILVQHSPGALAVNASSTPQLMNLFAGEVDVYASTSSASPVNLLVNISPEPGVVQPSLAFIISSNQFGPLRMLLPKRVCNISVTNVGAASATPSIIVIANEVPG